MSMPIPSMGAPNSPDVRLGTDISVLRHTSSSPICSLSPPTLAQLVAVRFAPDADDGSNGTGATDLIACTPIDESEPLMSIEQELDNENVSRLLHQLDSRRASLESSRKERAASMAPMHPPWRRARLDSLDFSRPSLRSFERCGEFESKNPPARRPCSVDISSRPPGIVDCCSARRPRSFDFAGSRRPGAAVPGFAPDCTGTSARSASAQHSRSPCLEIATPLVLHQALSATQARRGTSGELDTKSSNCSSISLHVSRHLSLRLRKLLAANECATNLKYIN
jgi:hypothetical protein